ncbi:NAD(P)H-dependent oxidoreductase [Empedobacter tilapiae]|uniref:Flavodoxin family protein n=1 Tax=Empedobacter tilapiae TaxID=2491114 RepID=A0A4Z1B9D8_9FLAO|nr:NAD(P)H-dependent oxidoreductase [Empedobacter tilapiae]TGN21639.1 flavodoxin family protein [Empedobacter tilapiae]
MKKIVVINGHPDKESFNSAIAQTYITSAISLGTEVRYIPIGELDFNPNLQFGYRKRMELEPDLVKALEDLHWSEHQVWIHPMWWLGMPAIMKGFFDRAFLPSIAFKINKNGQSEGLLEGKTARIITTAGDLSEKEYEEIYKSSGQIQLQKGILEYCGISPIQNDFIGPLIKFNEKDRNNWIEQVKSLAAFDSKIENKIPQQS